MPDVSVSTAPSYRGTAHVPKRVRREFVPPHEIANDGKNSKDGQAAPDDRNKSEKGRQPVRTTPIDPKSAGGERYNQKKSETLGQARRTTDRNPKTAEGSRRSAQRAPKRLKKHARRGVRNLGV